MKLNIFVSSTCYDLSQIRSDMRDFITMIGHNPILSEDYSFPIDTRKSSVENCIDTVKNHADLFILIIGNRYGHQLDDGKSITNIEFLTALQKGIPIYTFTLKQMINILPIWKTNKNGDYSNIVDSSKIFEFIDDIRSKYNLWNFEFERAQDIQNVLRSQLSILLKKSLITTNQLKNIDPFFVDNLSSKALEIIMKKEADFEIMYFYQLLEDAVSNHFSLKNDYMYSLKHSLNYSKLNFESFLDFSQKKYLTFINYLTSLEVLIHKAFKIYFAEPGVSSNLKGLYYVANKYGEYYRELLQWAIEFNSLIVDEELKELKDAHSSYPQPIIQEMEEFPLRSREEFLEAIEKPNKEGENFEFCSTIELSISDDSFRKVETALEKLKQSKGLVF